MDKSLIAFDTDHIQSYVFATDPLKEIRGASSLLDRLNRDVMRKLALSYDRDSKKIYANGGSGLFLIDSAKAVTFGTEVQRAYQQFTGSGASVTYVVQPLPTDAPENVDALMTYPMHATLAMLRYRLREQKGHPSASTSRPSHPLMRPCASCGIFYAVRRSSSEPELYCQSCLNKQAEDYEVRDFIPAWLTRQQYKIFKSPLWDKVLGNLQHLNYVPPSDTVRPENLNVFRTFRGAKDYLGLIYADANGMGKKLDTLETLQEVQDFAELIDDAIYWATCEAIHAHLPVQEQDDLHVFPFDILLIGGDDIVLVTPATQAMAVAHTLAERFYTIANGEPRNGEPQQQQDSTAKQEKHTLSVGVVLAPVNYPFPLLHKLAEDTLKFAKRDGSKTNLLKESQYGKTRLNFVVVSGSTSQSFSKVYDLLHSKDDQSRHAFYATLRPFTVEQLRFLLTMLTKGHTLALGRTKLHQLREAVLQLNLSTSVTESLAVLRSWKQKERNFVATKVYRTEKAYPLYQWDEANPTNFPIVTFPWFVDHKADGGRRYQTLLLDFVELYDFVAQAENNADTFIAEVEEDSDDED